MNIGEICNSIAALLHWPAQSYWVDNPAADAVLLMTVVNTVADKVLREVRIHALRAESSETGPQSGAITVNQSMIRPLNGSAYVEDLNTGYKQAVRGPVTETAWRNRRLRIPSPEPDDLYPDMMQFHQGYLYLLPSLKANQRLRYSYVSNNWVRRYNGTIASYLASDDDRVVMAPELLIHGCVWWINESEGHIPESQLARQRYMTAVVDSEQENPESY